MGTDRLRALLQDLPADDRALLECRIVDGWRYGDIAAHLAVPRGVLVDRARRLRTALGRMAKVLGAGGFAGGERAGALGLAGFYKISEDFGASHSWGRRCT